MTDPKPHIVLALLVAAAMMSAFAESYTQPATDTRAPEASGAIPVQDLEIVIPDVDTHPGRNRARTLGAVNHE